MIGPFFLGSTFHHKHKQTFMHTLTRTDMKNLQSVKVLHKVEEGLYGFYIHFEVVTNVAF